LDRPDDAPPPLATTGERLMTENRSHNVPEHLHRYALACGLARGIDTLDIACGEGYGTNLLASHAASVVGVDVSADAIAHASHKYKRSGLRFLHGSATAIPLPDASVDLVVSFETLEHLHEHDQMLAEIRRVLRPGGRLIMSSPDKRFYTDATGHKNQYHLRELYCEEFRTLIDRHFPHSQMMFQRIGYGSIILPEHPAPGFQEYRGNFTGFTAANELHGAMYNIAVASDAPLTNLTLSFWDCMSLYEERLQELELELHHARQQVTVAKKSLAMRVGRVVTAPLSLFGL
jgi:SAM-dependent methyltransferase